MGEGASLRLKILTEGEGANRLLKGKEMHQILGAAALLLACIGCSMLPGGKTTRTSAPVDYSFAISGAAGL